MSKALIISGFYGVGKKRLVSRDDHIQKVLVERKGKSPKDFIDEVEDKIKDYDLILVPSDKDTREELKRRDINFVLIYPKLELYEEYISKLKARGDNELAEHLKLEWTNLISELEDEEKALKIKLRSDQSLCDFFPFNKRMEVPFGCCCKRK